MGTIVVGGMRIGLWRVFLVVVEIGAATASGPPAEEKNMIFVGGEAGCGDIRKSLAVRVSPGVLSCMMATSAAAGGCGELFTYRPGSRGD